MIAIDGRFPLGKAAPILRAWEVRYFDFKVAHYQGLTLLINSLITSKQKGAYRTPLVVS